MATISGELSSASCGKSSIISTPSYVTVRGQVGVVVRGLVQAARPPSPSSRWRRLSIVRWYTARAWSSCDERTGGRYRRALGVGLRARYPSRGEAGSDAATDAPSLGGAAAGAPHRNAWPPT